MGRLLGYATLGVAVVAVGVLAVWLVALREVPVEIDEILSAYREDGRYGELTFDYPLNQTVFPPEIPAPCFRWQDMTDSDTWLVTMRFQGVPDRTSFVSSGTQWTPSDDEWEVIKRRSRAQEASITVLGIRRRRPEEILSAARIFISTSDDEVGAPLFYREVHLPFAESVADPAAHIRWRFGEISSREQPPVVLENLPVCANCHSFSGDGSLLGMDVDYGNDKASYIISPVSQETILDDGKIITWADYKKEDGERTLGFLSRVSPNGRYVVSTLKDFSVFVPLADLAFSQLFFPIRGILGVYDRETGGFSALPGADDPQFVQSNPVWSPDGKYVIFTRCKAYHSEALERTTSVLLHPKDCAEFLMGKRTFQYDLYRIPFNDGQGGKAEPLAGASNNGMSNYFPKCSPDGKWIVFCRAKSFMLLQPDSELFLIPAGGGEARRLRCNTKRMNSWHSWSPNSRWLVFSSKEYSPYTRLMLTHIDEAGRSSPPVELDRFTTSKTAANIPEFVNTSGDAIRMIRQQFVDAESYFRSASDAFQIGDNEAAERAYQMTLTLDPNHLGALHGLGVVLMERGDYVTAEAKFEKAIELDPDFGAGYHGLGSVRGRQGKFQEAIEPLRQALRIVPDDPDCLRMLGTVLKGLGRLKEGKAHLDLALRLDARYAESRPSLDLADGFLKEGKLEEAAVHYRRALTKGPDYIPALVGLASILATAEDEELRNGKGAVMLASKASQLTGYADPAALAVTAMAHAETGEFALAVQVAEHALPLARAVGENQSLARRLEQEIQLYRQHKPSRRSIGPWPARSSNESE